MFEFVGVVKEKFEFVVRFKIIQVKVKVKVKVSGVSPVVESREKGTFESQVPGLFVLCFGGVIYYLDVLHCSLVEGWNFKMTRYNIVALPFGGVIVYLDVFINI